MLCYTPTNYQLPSDKSEAVKKQKKNIKKTIKVSYKWSSEAIQEHRLRKYIKKH